MTHDHNQQEADALRGLAHSLTLSRPDMRATACEVETQVAAALASPTAIEAERAFDHVARGLRAAWLKSVAAETAGVMRSPTEREVVRLEHGRHDVYGYERDFQPESLEARCQAFFGAPPPGWTDAHVMFSSGQAALAAVLLHLAEGRRGKLRVAHVGAYFETRELVRRACAHVGDLSEADCIVVEPIACDGRIATHDPARIARGMKTDQTLIVDETLSPPVTRSQSLLSQAIVPGATVIRLVSGLKLLQQGLELANVGIVSLFNRDARQTAALADDLKRCRTLTGAGLRYVDALALEAPFFLDPAATVAYAERVFDHNGELARAVMAHNRLFKPLAEARLDGGAPYCAFELEADAGPQALHALAGRIEHEAGARGFLFERGGSFGFRGHRYDVIEPETGDPPFLRVALGARDDHSRKGIIEMMAHVGRAGAGAFGSLGWTTDAR